MEQKRTGRRLVRPPTDEVRKQYRQALDEERAGIEANRELGRELRERRRLRKTLAELKSIREQLGVTMAELAERTGMTVEALSRLENVEGPAPALETLWLYARVLGCRIEIAVVPEA